MLTDTEKKRRPWLSNTEKKRLADRDKLDPKIKARNEFIIRTKLKNWLDDSEEVLFALNNLDDKQLERFITDKHNFALFDIAERITHLLDTPGELLLRDFSGAFICRYVVSQMSPHFIYEQSPAIYEREVIRKATEEDLAREEHLKEHIQNLLNTLSPLEIKPFLIEIIDDRMSYNLIVKLIRELVGEYLSIKGAEKLIKTLNKELNARRQAASPSYRDDANS